MTSTFDGIDIAAVTAYREGVVASKYKGLQGLIKARGITVFEGEGKLASATVGAGRRHDSTRQERRSSPPARTPARCPVSRSAAASSRREQALELDFVPKKVVVLGGGVIGVEFASVWRSWGAEVTIVEALPHLVPNEDEAISKQFERAFRKRGIDFKLGVRSSRSPRTTRASS